MAMEIKIDPESKIVQGVSSGSYSREESQENFLNLVDAAVKHGIPKILLDARELKGTLSAVDRYFYAGFAADQSRQLAVAKLLPGGLSLAIVLPEDMFDGSKFGENVAFNRGMSFKVFCEFEKALAWLVSLP